MGQNLDQLTLNARTVGRAKQYLSHPAHALLIIGAAGNGKFSLAQSLLADLLNLGSIGDLNSFAYYTHLVTLDGKQEIPIANVRGMIANMKLRVPAKSGIKRVVIIENAHQLSAEAQNALLKQLEEPPEDTLIILTTTSEQDLLPTVVSRMQSLNVYPVPLASSQKFFLDKFEQKDIKSAWSLSGGAFGLLSALLAGDSTHPLKIAVEEVKLILSQPLYERVLGLERLSRDKGKLKLFLDAAARVLAALHRAQVQAGDKTRAAKLLSSRQLTLKLQEQLNSNSNPRLVALQLAINLRT